MAQITLENVTLSRQNKTLLKDITWKVNKGEHWAILGLNGSGKTSLLKLITAEYWTSQGSVEVLGNKFGGTDISNMRTKIGIVGSFIAERLSPHMLAEKIVLTGKYKSSILYTEYGEKELNEARQMLISIGGEHLLGRIYASLSQGEKQLLLIARSLMEEPEILILDEATSGLDLFAREKLLRQIEQITTLPKAPTILYVTHHAEEITRSFTHVLLLKKGQIIAEGPKNEVLTETILSDFYDQKVSIVPLGDDRIYIKPEF
ncbi:MULTISPECIES: ABC transporter ATP-binding protein [Streptococcus]|jgi:iron complex transport system ATP-binding protein|uniref:Iron complex transport system ATP-binding protein n=1 Tax=Streptococcus equinus JB1 TaxID=1294274 RepID=A0A091BUV1_STREI|nr:MULTISPECIES: ABC transporter ATP-binding protein [Streptococcus]KEY47412.1 molybdenum ABC transporter ATP-binding protein [Streptococcus equinus]KFN88509.1 molybdenum ABC transporter ATP-binding protein [Streptococcus equinus JB1]MBE6162417.1 ABC transporter ATP-binding protein [Streptococcus equinus]MDO4885935.1 ABC transporter ATP-binding protein [Streptococcus sp.]QGX44669.1 ATP-binding cassette domain-containing protein [Streptococcus equinus]